MYQVELVWNRSFSFVPYGSVYESIEEAKGYAISLLYMGDGARVKECQIVDAMTGEVVLHSYEITQKQQKQ